MQLHRSAVLVVGGGPVGLTAALALARQNIDVTVLETERAIPTNVRASTLHCASLDLLDEIGVTSELLKVGYRVRHWQIRDKQEGIVAEWDLDLLREDTKFPFRVACEQHKLSRILLRLLQDLPNANVIFNATVESIELAERHASAAAHVDGEVQTFSADYLIGADGGRSIVRKCSEIEFEGFTWPEQFLGVSTTYDFGQDGFPLSSYVADPEEWAALFKVPHDGPPGLWKLMFPVAPETSLDVSLSDIYIQEKMQRFRRSSQPYTIVHRNIYRVHQRVAKQFRKGRVLLIGDAAHVNNPVGALGLNSGLHDAINLSHKLGKVVRDAGDEGLLGLFERQRRAVSLESVQADSIRNKRLLEERDPEIRKAHLDEIRATAKNSELARGYLLKSSMIDSVRRAAQIS